ncbi:MAG: hypothetical protein LBD30_02875 [Verrucomicrobiales bacterium]|jgi:cell division protein FtsZ|nr:hypothetical protein [Verrucomicrobiales bacterium]
MIDFKHDGEFSLPDTNSLAGHVIIGLGSAGVNMVDQIMLERRDGATLFGFDTDEQIIRGSVLDNKRLLGAGKIHGMGAGGDPSLAAEIAREERAEVIDLLQGVRSAVLVAGLGGGTGSGMAPEFCRMLKQLGATVIVVAVTPFAFEGKRRLHQTVEALTVMRREADAVLCLSNGRLTGLSGREVNIRDGFATMNRLVGRMCLNLRAVLNRKGPMQIHLADIRNLLAEHDCGGVTMENCWTGFGAGAGADRAHEAVDKTLNSPLFADGQVWTKGAAVIACLSGGGNLSVGEFQSALEYLRQEIPVELPILAGAILEPCETDTLGLTLMVIGQMGVEEEELPKPRAREEFAFEPKLMADAPSAEEISDELDETPVKAPQAADNDTDLFGVTERKSAEQRYFVQQEELPLDKKIYRGRFEKSAPTIFNGEDLDQPTFMRRNVKIRL